MNPAWLPPIAFVCCATGAFGLIWLGRHFVRVFDTSSPPTEKPRLVFRRAEKLGYETNGVTGSFDSNWERFVMDTGLPMTGTAALLALLGLGVLFAAGVYVATEEPVLTLLALVAGWVVGIVALFALRSRRQTQILTHLPGLVEMLARAVRAGESVEQALRAVSQKAEGPLAADLRRTVGQIDLGLPLTTALRRLEERHRQVDVRMVIGALVLHRTAGGNLPATLERLSTVTRERLDYRRQFRAVTGSARMAAIAISLAAPCLFIYLAYTKRYMETMLDDPSGQFFLMVAVGLELAGIFWLLALSRNEM